MWGLYREDGTPFREGFPSQWEAVRTAKREDGSSFKKAEALLLPSETTVYRQFSEPLVMALPTIKDDGTFGKSYIKKTTKEKLTKLVLREMVAQ